MLNSLMSASSELKVLKFRILSLRKMKPFQRKFIKIKVRP